MAPQLFIAVQCCQCSTMQVKQQKKSSNKWTCVVCNQKQSVRQVFAQGSMAKDVRLFVQSFNMSRQFEDNPVTQAPQDDREIDEISADWISRNHESRKQKRSDWNEYLDFEEPTCTEECDGDVKIVTELPKEMFKKPKLKDYIPRSDKQAEYGKLYRPAFSKRHALKNAISRSPPDIEPRKDRQSNSTVEYKLGRPDSSQFTTARASKWETYIAEDDTNLQLGEEKNFVDETDQKNLNAFSVTTRAQKVEDDIHPDFM